MPKRELELFDSIITLTDNPDIKAWKGNAAIEAQDISRDPIKQGHYFHLITKEGLLNIAEQIKIFAEQMH